MRCSSMIWMFHMKHAKICKIKKYVFSSQVYTFIALTLSGLLLSTVNSWHGTFDAYLALPTVCLPSIRLVIL